jgi:hypothetical protein
MGGRGMHEGGMHEGGEGHMFEIWEMLPEDQKRKILAMKLEMKLLWMQMKIDEMQKMIDLKKKAMGNIKYVHDVILQGGQQQSGQQQGGK